jgi:hypothetical protein
VTPAEWEQRFKARIIELLSGGDWLPDQMQETADNEFEALTEATGEDSNWGLDESPEASADECLSYWDDDGE